MIDAVFMFEHAAEIAHDRRRNRTPVLLAAFAGFQSLKGFDQRPEFRVRLNRLVPGVVKIPVSNVFELADQIR